jgi:hypothetical protein
MRKDEYFLVCLLTVNFILSGGVQSNLVQERYNFRITQTSKKSDFFKKLLGSELDIYALLHSPQNLFWVDYFFPDSLIGNYQFKVFRIF